MSRKVTRIDTKPRIPIGGGGIAQDNARCDDEFCGFNPSTFSELRRRGITPEALEGYIKAARDRLGPSASGALIPRADVDVIRAASPRKVELILPPDGKLGAKERAEIAKIRAVIARNEHEIVRIRGTPDESNDFAVELENTNIFLRGELDRLGALDRDARTISVHGLDIAINDDANEVQDNPLNCFVDVQYHVSLTMMDQTAALDFQTFGFNTRGEQIDIDTLKKNRREDGSVTLASTGEVFRNDVIRDRDPLRAGGAVLPAVADRGFDQKLVDRNYYSIISTSIKNLMEPSANNPLVSTMLSMKMRIAEPHGFKLHEDIRDTACQLGYEDINPGRILYRVDIYFSGYNQDTGEWIEQIDVSNGRGIKTISYVVGISAIEAEVTSSGTVYELDMVPAGHHAYRPEDFILDATSFATGTTFRDFLTNLSTALKQSKEDRVVGQLLRNYEFFAPKLLLDSPFDIEQFTNQHRFLFELDDEHIAASGKDVDLLTILRGAMANTKFVQDLFLADDNNSKFNIPRIHFGIRFNTIYGDTNGAVNIDPTLNDYKEITHQYLIEPFITFKHGTVTRDTMSDYVDPESQLDRIREIIRFGMLRRIYDYIYTPDNTEVIDFDIKLRAFYYETLNTPSLGGAAAGEHRYAGSSNRAILDREILRDLVRVEGEGVDDGSVDQVIRRLFGDVRSGTGGVSPGSKPRVGAARLGGGFNETPDTRFFGDVASPERRRGDYETYLGDYLNLDLLKLNGMQIRGDPVWLLNPYGNFDIDTLGKIEASEGVGSTDPGSTLRVKPRTGQVIFLKMFAPDQDDYMNPNRERASSYPNIIGGFYQVLDVTSTFENGRFTQSMEGVKMNHLNYAEELFEKTAVRKPRRAGG